MPDSPTALEISQENAKTQLEVLKSITDINAQVGSLSTQLEERQKTFKDEMDNIHMEGIKTVTEELCGTLQSKQDAELQQKEIKKQLDGIERAALSVGSSKKSEDTDGEFKHHFSCFLRKRNYEIPEKVLKSYVEKHVEHTTYGATDSAKEYVVKAFMEGSNPAGGYNILPDRSNKIIERNFETSPVREFANIETTQKDSFQVLIDDEEITTGGWEGEITKPTGTATNKFGLLTIPIHRLVAEPKATQDYLEDVSFDLSIYILGKASRKFTRESNTAFVVGDSSQKPQGFLTLEPWAAPGVYETGKLEQINSGAAAAVTSAGVIRLQNALHQDFQGNAIFVMKRATFGDFLELNIGTNDARPLINFNLLKEGTDLRMLGKRVVFMDDIEAVAANDLAVAYGDFGLGYTIVDRRGIRVIRDELTDKPFVLFNMTLRTGGAVSNFDSIKIQKIAA